MNPGATHRRILTYLDNRIAGATDEEMALDLGIPANTLRPRRQELVRMGKVEASKNRRLTFSDHEAIVWVACDHAPGEPAPHSRAKRIAAAAEPFIIKAEEMAESFSDLPNTAVVRIVMPMSYIRALAQAAGDDHG